MDEVRRNIHLVAAFLFVAGCDTLPVEKTAHLMHNIMRSDGIIERDKTTEDQIVRFDRKARGYKDYIAGETPSKVHAELAEAVMGPAANYHGNRTFLDHEGDMGQLAELLHTVFTALRDVSVRHIILRGTHSGLWIAALLMWLRPKDVVVLGPDRRSDTSTVAAHGAPSSHIQLYPRIVANQHLDTGNEVRVSIVLENPPPGSARFGSWAVEKWTVEQWSAAPGSKPDVIRIELDPNLANPPRRLSCPLKAANFYIANQFSNPQHAVDVGHLSAALVVTAVHKAVITGKESGASAVPLVDICSEWFLNSHGNLITMLGWRQSQSDTARRDRIVKILDEYFDTLAGQNEPASDSDDLVELMSICMHNYFVQYGCPPWLPSNFINQDVFAMSVHLAAEMLVFSFCDELPVNATYHPLEPDMLEANDKLLRKLLVGTSLSYWDFRDHCMLSLLSTARKASPADLALADQGYVVHSGLLSKDVGLTTERRKVSLIMIRPGSIGLEGDMESFQRVTEGDLTSILAGRCMAPAASKLAIDVVDPSQGFLPAKLREKLAIKEVDVSVEHRIRTSDGAVYLASYVHNHLFATASTPARSEAPWQLSIEAILLSDHIATGSSFPQQIRQLGNEWWQKGLLTKLQWCPAGLYILPDRPYITCTAGDDTLRFFEAGCIWKYLHNGFKLFIRQSPVTLVYCLEEVLRRCENKERWVIVA